MTDDEWNAVPQEVRTAIRKHFGAVLPWDVDFLDWRRCAVGLPYVQRIDLNITNRPHRARGAVAGGS